MKIEIVRVDGSTEIREVTGDPTQVIEKEIGATSLDFVNLRDGRVMAVDDNGYEYELIQLGPNHYEHCVTKANKPVNQKATALYHAVCIPGTTHQIVGDVVICVDSDFA